MNTAIQVPELPESVSDATVAQIHVEKGQSVPAGTPLFDLETDKVMLEVEMPEDGKIEEIAVAVGDIVTSEALLARFKAGKVAEKPQAKEPKAETAKTEAAAAPSQALSPSVRREVQSHDVDPSQLHGTGRGGRITVQDVQQQAIGHRQESRVPMSRLRATIAKRLLAAQQEAAILTTFNEVDMQPIMDLRAKYKDKFIQTHDVKLGFMSFFVKAVITALQRFPDVNAGIDGQDLVYHGYYDIGIAVSSPRGLVVPVIRNAESLSLAEIEKTIKNFAIQAKEGSLSLDDMKGGTFSITNGGTFGSMLSTPIINPPQSAILGMHNIVERPVAINHQVEIRPIMYLALSYDHRIIDGAQSVKFLVTIKELLEDPARLLLDI